MPANYNSREDTAVRTDHDEKDSDVVSILGSDPDTLLVGSLTLHLCPEVGVEQNTITA